MQEVDERCHLGLDLLFGAEDVRIVLGESAHAHDAVQGARGLIAVAAAEFGQPERQVSVGFQTLVEHLYVTGAVHWLDRELAIFRLQHEHVIAKFIGMPGTLPKRHIHQLWRTDLLIAVRALRLPHVLLNRLIQRPAVRMPENHTRRFLLRVEQVQLLADFAVIAFFRFLDAGEVFLELLLVGPCSAVNTLQHLVVGVAAPICARHLGQLECLELAGAGHVRPTAQVHPRALLVNGQLLSCRQAFDNLYFIVLTHVAEQLNSALATHDQPLDRQVIGDDLLHALLDLLEVFRGKVVTAGKIVVKAIIDHGANGHLGARKQFLHRHGQQVRSGMPYHLQARLIALRDNRQADIAVNDVTGIHRMPVHNTRQRSLGQARANCAGNIVNRDGCVELALAAVGEGNRKHAFSLVSVVTPTKGHVSGLQSKAGDQGSCSPISPKFGPRIITQAARQVTEYSLPGERVRSQHRLLAIVKRSVCSKSAPRVL